MRKLMVTTFLTLDGVMQAPGGPGEDDSGGFALGGWSVNYWDDQMGEIMGEAMSAPFDLVLGRKTYDIFAAHWPHATDDPAGIGHVVSHGCIRMFNQDISKLARILPLGTPIAIV